MVFVDEKKLKIGDILTRTSSRGYSRVNQRLPTRYGFFSIVCYVFVFTRMRTATSEFKATATPRQEIIGALAYMPNRARELYDGRLGDVGMIDFMIQEPKLDIDSILYWVRTLLLHICSSIILD